jgi:hypothetical protein
MSDLGPLSYFLGIEVQQTPKGFYLSQSKYIKDLLDRSGLTDIRKVATPMDIHLQLHPDGWDTTSRTNSISSYCG